MRVVGVLLASAALAVGASAARDPVPVKTRAEAVVQVKAAGGYALAAAIAVPVALAFWFRDQFILSVQPTTWGTEWVLRLGLPGMVLFGVLLLSSVGVVMNLERTFRASVGTMRWRIKFMLLGVGLIFVVRIYTSSQVLLFRGFDSSLDTLNSGALLVGSLLMLRSLARTGHFDLEVYPSQSVLQNSVDASVESR